MATNAGNFIQNGSYFDMKTCADGAPSDNTQLNATEIPEENVTAVLTEVFGTGLGPQSRCPPSSRCTTRARTAISAA